ncbi:MAG: hypothetical protein JW862_12380 [Anaerolineales bacterium]|nr:hypothetical protein [Anaerolineales bacterium]
MDRKIHLEPTLYIAAGTSAGQVLWRIKQLQQQVNGEIPIHRYFWVDTDQNIDPGTAQWFTAMERATLTGFSGDQVLANLRMYPEIKDWWPQSSRLKPGFIRHGAKQIRPYGRLAFFRKYSDRSDGPSLIDKLRAHLNALQKIVNYDFTEKKTDRQQQFAVEGSPRVVIFFSTCGGSGSSMAFDLAYICQSLLKTYNPTIYAVAMMPSVIDQAIKNEAYIQREKIRANTYAWFKEHEYLLNDGHWNVKYPEGAAIEVNGPPFDLTFLVDMGNQAGYRLSSENDIYTMTAQAVFLITGSTLSNFVESFNANLSVQMSPFRGKHRAYSSLAAASLILPAEKITGYCGARLAEQALQVGMLAEPDADKVAEAADAILGRLGLRDTVLMGKLLEDKQISLLNQAAIRRASGVEKIILLLQDEQTRSQAEIQAQSDLIAKQAQGWLPEIYQSLKGEVAQMVRTRGLAFAMAVLATLLKKPVLQSQVPEDTLSFAGLKQRLAQRGITEDQVAAAEDRLKSAWTRLRSLDGEFLTGVWKTLLKKSWLKELDHARGDCLQALFDISQSALQLAAQRAANELYTQLVDRITKLEQQLAKLVSQVRQTALILDQRAQGALQPAELDTGIYELALEAVDAEYILDFYRTRADQVVPQHVFSAYMNREQDPCLDAILTWDPSLMAVSLQNFGRTYFQEYVDELSLIEALVQYHGEEAPAVIERLFDRLVRYCHPFWQYFADSGISGQEGKSVIGVADANNPNIPAKYRHNVMFEIKSTGLKHRIDLARVQHGLPAFLLREMADNKAFYDQCKKGFDPLHVIPNTSAADEIIPEENQEGRHLFAVALAFGYIIQIGAWYYFDPTREYSSHKIRPARENRLAQGRENAEEVFCRQADLAHQVEQLIEREIENIGNQAAIQKLGEKISQHKEALSNMGAENDLRYQIEREINGLHFQRTALGYMGEALPLAG